MAGEQVSRAGASWTVPFPRSPPQARPRRSDGREAGRRVCRTSVVGARPPHREEGSRRLAARGHCSSPDGGGSAHGS